MPHIQDYAAAVQSEIAEMSELGSEHSANQPPRPDQDPVAAEWLYFRLWAKATSDSFSDQDLIGMAA